MDSLNSLRIRKIRNEFVVGGGPGAGTAVGFVKIRCGLVGFVGDSLNSLGIHWIYWIHWGLVGFVGGPLRWASWSNGGRARPRFEGTP